MSKKYTTNFLEDTNGSTGSSNQVLISTPSGIDWVDGSGSGIIGGPYLPLAGGTMTGSIKNGDGVYSYWGTGDDLQIGHDGANSYIIDRGIGDLLLYYSDDFVVSKYGTSEISIRANQDSSVELFFDNTKKFETTSTGVSVTGSLVVSNDITATGDLDVRDIDARNGIFTGNVGIGTTSPSEKLEVSGSIKVSNAYPRIYLADTQGVPRTFSIGTSNEDLIINSGSTDVLSILGASGNVGIGTTSPGNIFVVESGTSSSAVEFVNTNSDANPSGLVLKKLSTTPADNDVLGRIIFQGNNDATTPGLRTFARIETVATDVTDGEEDGDLYFYTTNEGNQSAKLRILDVGAIQSRTSGLIQLNYRNGSSYSYIAPTVYNNWNRIGTFTSPGNGARIFTEILAKGDNNYPYWMKGTVVVSFYSTGVSVSCQTDGGYAGGHNFQCIVTKDGTTYDVWLRVPTIEWSSFVSYRTLYNSGFTENYIFTIASGNVSNSAPTGVDDETNSIEPNSSFRFTNTDLKTPTHQYRAQNFLIDGSTTVEFQHDKNIFTEKVGIGTTSPSAKLHVLGSSSGNATTKAEMLSNSAFSVRPHSTNSGTLAIAQVDNGNSVGMQFTNGSGTANWDISMQPFGGNVGIGTDSPSQIFTIENNSGFFRINTSTSTYPRIEVGSASGSTAAIINRITGSQNIVFGESPDSGNYIFRGGNVGIGTISPGYKLDVNGTIGFAYSGANANYIEQANSGFGYGRIIPFNSSGLFAFDTNYTFGGGYDFKYNGSSIIRITSSGNVGIGTTSPSSKLVIQTPFTNSASDSYIEINSGHEASGGSDITGVAGFLFKQAGSGNVLRNAGSIISGRESNYSTDSLADSYLSFFTAVNNVNTEKMRIDSAGKVSVGSPVFGQLGVRGTTDDSTAYSFEATNSSGNSLLIVRNDGQVWIPRSNVGIGTTSPATKLHVSGANTVMRLSSTSSYVDMIMTNSSNTGFLNLDGSKMNFFVGGGSSGDLKMSIGTNGNVGIGTTSPAVQLELGDNTADEKLRLTGAASGKPLMTFYNTTTKIGQIASSSVGVTVSSLGSGNMTFENGTGLLVIENGGNVGIGTTSPHKTLDVTGSIRSSVDLTVGETGQNGYTTIAKGDSSGDVRNSNIIFQRALEFRSDGGSTDNILRLEHTGNALVMNGNVGIGATSPSSKLHVKDTSLSGTLAYFEASASAQGTTNVRVDCLQYGIGIAFFRDGSLGGGACSFRNDSGTQVGSINIGTSSTFYSTSSDYRLKENLTLITDGIDRLKQLKPKRFNFVGETQVVDGFVAHEAKEVVPESVTGEKDEVLPNGDPVYQGIDQAKIVPLLTAALQEAVAKIEDLENRIQTLENK